MKGLDNLIDLEVDAREFGFEWPDLNSVIDQVRSECDEVKGAVANGESRGRVQEEVGDLLHAVVSLCVFLDLDVYETIDGAENKFARRMAVVKKLAKDMNLLDLKGQPNEIVLKLWKRAKEIVYSEV
jgi:uncharacterized protein YabN with tetrapyrrole methylase and pyrophosphatase domain